jgi:hypothetical protein
MRTKALLVLALSSGGMSLALGQTVSQNVVGYINLAVPAGLSMIANQLDNKTGNKVGDLFPTAPDGTTLLTWTGRGFGANTYFGVWDTPAAVLAPGQGAFIDTGATATTLLLVGEVMLGAQSVDIQAGLSLISSKVPVELTVGDMTPTGPAAFPAGDGDVIFQWTGKAYSANTYFGAWDNVAAKIKVGESFFVQTDTAKTWTRTFNVN